MRTSLRQAIDHAYLADEAIAVNALLGQIQLEPSCQQRITEQARNLVTAVRAKQTNQSGLDAFMHEYNLSSQEGILLMCLAEALLRIPDATTADKLIQDKLSQANWEKHLGQSNSLLVNAATWSLMLTGRIIKPDSSSTSDFGALFTNLLSRSSEPIIRSAIKEAMRIMGHQFVMGRTIEEALTRSKKDHNLYYRYSFDMLGEAALTRESADNYFVAYQKAIAAIAKARKSNDTIIDAPGISIKLTALHPRFELAQYEQVMQQLVPRVLDLAEQAMHAGINVTLDAEEAERLDLSLDIFQAVFEDAKLRNWEGLGLAVQAYQKRAIHVIDWLIELARQQQKRILLRLVKGAYWDTEIKRAQERGLQAYPVFTRKAATDVSYLVCAKHMLAASDAIYAQFATHNVHTVATILELGEGQDYEFQRLHGMGENLYDVLLFDNPQLHAKCRTYAPVGSHEDLLPYLVRRLLENGANTSFVNRLEDLNLPLEELITDPVTKIQQLKCIPHPKIPLPKNLYGEERCNSQGINLHDQVCLDSLVKDLAQFSSHHWQAVPLINNQLQDGKTRRLYSPADSRQEIGQVIEVNAEMVKSALNIAHQASEDWKLTTLDTRVQIIERAAELIEQNRTELIALCIREAGRCIPDALAEVREAVDFCRYYASLANKCLQEQCMPGPTGEFNQLNWQGRGIFACISPWNFPLAIFIGQITAALVAGNTVIAKPAQQTSLIAMRAVQLLHQAGIPAEVLHLIPGSSAVIAKTLWQSPHIAGVALTGSTETAQRIYSSLASRNGPIVPLIAETGGQNVLIADSSALPEQLVNDVLRSAFNSAGQRCSALRVLFIQEEIKARVLALLQGAMAELVIGDPGQFSTDVGPVIDTAALQHLARHKQRMQRNAHLIYETSLPKSTEYGTYMGPTAYEIGRLDMLEEEVFGPILHVIGYSADKLDEVIAAVNVTGFGLTLGIHSRIETTIEYIQQHVRIGNIYVNRDMIGAVVGVQPFGGQGLSGTGPKAGGPHYLYRFAAECTLSTNLSAIGGNASLLSMQDD